MNDKKKGKGNPKRPSRKKSISSFSKLVEDRNKQFKDLFSSSTFQDSVQREIQRIEEEQRKMDDERRRVFESLGLPSETELEIYRKQAEESLSFEIDEITRIHKSTSDQYLKELENSRSLIDYHTMLEQSLLIDIDELKQFEGRLIDLPITEFEKALNEFNSYNIHVNEFKPIKSIDNEYLLKTTFRETFNFGNITFNTIQQTQLQVQSLHGEVKEMNQFMREDAKKKDEMIQDLFDYFRNDGTSIVKINKIKYNKKTAELIIDDKIIGIKADTNQHYLCKVLFSSKSSITKAWEIYDIVEALGEDPNILEGWIKVIYNTIRRLNEKIQLQTGIERFILYNNKTVLINPKYIDLA